MISLHETEERPGAGVVGGKGKGTCDLYGILPQLQKEHHNVSVPPTWAVPTAFFEDTVCLPYLRDTVQEAAASRGQNYSDVVRAFWYLSQDARLIDELKILVSANPGPLSIRSSSVLEDFATITTRHGKRIRSMAGAYSSYFYPNPDSLSAEERAIDVFRMMSMVMANNFNPHAYELLQSEGMNGPGSMAVLIQPVTGEMVAPGIFAPIVSGVVYTQNPVPWSKKLAREDGLARLVLGMGTRAVNPRYAVLMAPGNPNIGVRQSLEAQLSDSQENLDIVDFNYRPLLEHFLPNYKARTVPGLAERSLIDMLNSAPSLIAKFFGAFKAYDHTKGERGELVNGLPHYAKRAIITLHDWGKKLGPALKESLDHADHLLGYEGGADFEVSLLGNMDNPTIYILQQRPLGASTRNYMPSTPPVHVLVEELHPRLILKTTDYAIDCRNEEISNIVYVTPEFFSLSSNGSDRGRVAKLISVINTIFYDRGLKYALIGPGRWGDINESQWGIPVRPADIVGCSILVGYRHGSCVPDRGLGEHLYKNPIIERGIIPIALEEVNFDDIHNPNYLNHGLLTSSNKLVDMLGDEARRFESIIYIKDISQISSRLAVIKGNRKIGTMIYIKNSSGH